MTWLTALSVGVAADLFVAALLVVFVRADKRYQAEKLARLRAEGAYGPDVAFGPVRLVVTTIDVPSPLVVPEARAITAGPEIVLETAASETAVQ